MVGKKHPADNELKKGSQRILDYMPNAIYLKVGKANVVIHEKLGAGVWPLSPVKRTCIINNKTGSTIVRKGFTLVPDYASTAFMMQGATLEAQIAECGDVFSEPTLDDALTTYVILSRVKKACQMLLLRAFCPNLFRMGSPPGPACLIKHLKHRLGASSTTQSVKYNTAILQLFESYPC